MQPLFDLAFQRSAAEDDKTEEGDDAQDQADDPWDAVGVQLAAVQTQKEQDVRQKADADVHEQIDQRICREPAAQKGKHEVAP